MITRILILIFLFIFSLPLVSAANGDIDNNINIRDVNISTSGNSNTVLSEFYDVSDISSFFFIPSDSGSDSIIDAFTTIAFQIKNIVIVLALIFLAVAVIRLLFSSSEEEAAKKWRGSIIWVTVGIFVMQMAFSIWQALLLRDATGSIDSSLGWTIWLKIFSPVVSILQMFASLAFFLMVLYAFYTIVGGAGDEEKLKKGKKTIIYGLVGFFLLKVPETIITAFYGGFNCRTRGLGIIEVCTEVGPNTVQAVSLIGRIITYFNGFLMLVCVLLIIYAGWLVLISGGDEEKLKKAKSTILYVLIGFVVLVASHAIFRFFILQ